MIVLGTPSKFSGCPNGTNNRPSGAKMDEQQFFSRHLYCFEPLTVLGTTLALQDTSQVDVRNRVASGWRFFWAMKSMLLHKDASVKKRLRLFDSTVNSCVLWCTQSWTPRVEEMRLLKTARRAMLRRIVGPTRAPEEEYLTWITRTARKAETLVDAVGVRDWNETHFRAKWQWGGHVARRSTDSWLWRVSTWRDSEWQTLVLEAGIARALRPSRRRWTKWEDAFRSFCAAKNLGPWTGAASNREASSAQVDSFIAQSCLMPTCIE